MRAAAAAAKGAAAELEEEAAMRCAGKSARKRLTPVTSASSAETRFTKNLVCGQVSGGGQREQPVALVGRQRSCGVWAEAASVRTCPLSGRGGGAWQKRRD